MACMSPFVGRAVRRSDIVEFDRGGLRVCERDARSCEVLLATEAASRGIESRY